MHLRHNLASQTIQRAGRHARRVDVDAAIHPVGLPRHHARESETQGDGLAPGWRRQLPCDVHGSRPAVHAEARHCGLVLQRHERAPNLGVHLIARKAQGQHLDEAPGMLPLRVRCERRQGYPMRHLSQDAARHLREARRKGHLRHVLPLVPVRVGLEVVHPGDQAPAGHVLRLGSELEDGGLAGRVADGGVYPGPAGVQRLPPQMPVLHAVARLAATTRWIRWPESCGILVHALGPALLDLAVLGASQKVVEAVPHLRAGQVVDELESHGVEESRGLHLAFPVLEARGVPALAQRVGGNVLPRLEGTLALLPLELLALFGLLLPLLVGPAALDDHAQGVQVFGQALVRLPRGARRPATAVLHEAEVGLVVRGRPLDHVEVLVEAALGMQEGLPGRQVFRQALNGVPAL
mmetsp:Transcript_9907/g.29630  ORF Transcript_9907/g.29630 Transcript_9907/m.29630 type:complete len:408 (-) Transcript_9907:586-1809(-)